jgi:hypothetical protein
VCMWDECVCACMPLMYVASIYTLYVYLGIYIHTYIERTQVYITHVDVLSGRSHETVTDFLEIYQVGLPKTYTTAI